MSPVNKAVVKIQITTSAASVAFINNKLKQEKPYYLSQIAKPRKGVAVVEWMQMTPL